MGALPRPLVLWIETSRQKGRAEWPESQKYLLFFFFLQTQAADPSLDCEHQEAGLPLFCYVPQVPTIVSGT